MNDFDNLIIEAFRNKNFKFAAEATDLDPEVSALAILNQRLNAALKAKNNDTELVEKIYSVYLKAQSFLITKLGNEVDAPFSYNKVNDVFVLSNIGDPQADKFYQALMVNILERLGESGSPASPASTRSNPIASDNFAITVDLIDKTSNESLKYTFTGPFSVGRGESSNIRLNDTKVSTNHCSFVQESGIWYISDSGSKNGTFLNGVVLSINQKEKLKLGDKIQFVDYEISVTNLELIDESSQSSSSQSGGQLNSGNGTSSPASTTETLSTTSEPKEREFKKTKLVISIQTGTQVPKNYTILNPISIGSKPSDGGITIEDYDAAADHIYFLSDPYGVWKVIPIQAKDTYFNGTLIEPNYSELAENDMIYFSNTRVKILKIEDAPEAESPSS